MWGHGLDRFGSGQGRVASNCECGNEASGSLKSGETLEQLENDGLSRMTLLHGVLTYDTVMMVAEATEIYR